MKGYSILAEYFQVRIDWTFLFVILQEKFERY
jgi:hypothetical protein